MTELQSPVVVLALGFLFLGCRVIEITTPVYGAGGEIRRAEAAHVWNVLADGAIQGEVVLFESVTRPEDTLYMVRNVWQQDMGLVDSLGRAYRFVPHADEPVWVGTGTVAQGASRILQLEGDCTLVEVSIGFLPLPDPAPPPHSSDE